MSNLTISPTRGLRALGRNGKEYKISVPVGFSTNHCILMVEPGSAGNGGHDVRSAFLLEKGYEGLVTDAKNIYDLVSKSSKRFYPGMPSSVLQNVHVLNSGAAEGMGGVFEIKNIENPESYSNWNHSTNNIMYFYPDVLVTDSHILKLNPSSNQLRILSNEYGFGDTVVSMNDPRVIVDHYDGLKAEVIIRRVDNRPWAIDQNRKAFSAGYKDGGSEHLVTDVINFNGHVVYAVELQPMPRGGMSNISDPQSSDLLEIPHPQEIPAGSEITRNRSFKFFKSRDGKRLFLLSHAHTSITGSLRESSFVVINEVYSAPGIGGPNTTQFREIYCETLGTFLDELQPSIFGSNEYWLIDDLDYHEFGILSISEERHTRILEIIGDSDEITITNFTSDANINTRTHEVIQPNATVVVTGGL